MEHQPLVRIRSRVYRRRWPSFPQITRSPQLWVPRAVSVEGASGRRTERTTGARTTGGVWVLRNRPLNTASGPHEMLAVAGVAVHVVSRTRIPAAQYRKRAPLVYPLLHHATTSQVSDISGGAFGLCRPGVGKPRAQGTRRLRAVLSAPAGRLASATQYAAVATCPETRRTALARIRTEGSHHRDAVVTNPPPHRTTGH